MHQARLLVIALALVACKKADDNNNTKPASASGTATASASGSASASASGSASGSAPAVASGTGSAVAPASGSAVASASGSASASGAAPTVGEGAIAADGNSVTLGYRVPAVGAKWTETKNQNTQMTIPKMGDMTQERAETKMVEVLAASADRVTKEKVTFSELSEKMTQGGQSKEKPQPTAGKTYILEITPGAADPTVTHDDGSPASPEETAAVLHAEKDFRKGDAGTKALAGKTFAKGEAVELPSDVMDAMFGGDDDDKPQKATMTMTFTGAEGSLAKFDVKMDMSGEEKGMHTEVSLTGTVEIDPVTGVGTDLHVTGPMKLSGPITAEGTMTMEEKTTME